MNKTGDTKGLWRVSGMGVELVGAILGMMFIGWLIDRWQGTAPRWLTIGALVGLVGGGLNFIRKALALNKAATEQYKRDHQRPHSRP